MKTSQAVPVDRERDLNLIEVLQPTRELHDIVLSDKTRSALDEVLLEHNRADVLRAHGLEPAQKLLFFGPPGCGKTLAAEILAMELSLPLALIRLDSIVASFLGETAANLRKVFDFVSETPVVALFDEFDALAKSRDDVADHGELKRVVNALLQLMDGYRGRSVLIAATNHEGLLDPAIWRRFDEIIQFERPSPEKIKQLLALKLSGVRRQFDPSDSHVANMFKGMAHADIERVLRRAVKEMVLQGREFLDQPHLEEALSREYTPKRGVFSVNTILSRTTKMKPLLLAAALAVSTTAAADTITVIHPGHIDTYTGTITNTYQSTDGSGSGAEMTLSSMTSNRADQLFHDGFDVKYEDWIVVLNEANNVVHVLELKCRATYSASDISLDCLTFYDHD